MNTEPVNNSISSAVNSEQHHQSIKNASLGFSPAVKSCVPLGSLAPFPPGSKTPWKRFSHRTKGLRAGMEYDNVAFWESLSLDSVLLKLKYT